MDESQKLLAQSIFVSPQTKFYIFFLSGLVSKELFYDSVKEFQSDYMKQIKYKYSYKEHVPHGSIALGHFLLELPNFSERLSNEYRSLLDKSEENLNKAIDIAKGESVLFELDFSAIDALRDMAEVCFL